MTPERPTSPARGPARDPLADFVAAHRGDFDDERPGATTWDEICARLDADAVPPTAGVARAPRLGRQTRGSTLRRFTAYWRQAAAAAAILVLGLVGGMLIAGDGEPARALRPVAERSSSGEAELAVGEGLVLDRVDDLERAYRNAIEQRLRQVEAYGPDPEVRRELTSLAEPEFSATAELALAPPGSERAVVEAMVAEYQAKLDALEHVLERLRATEQRRGTDPATQRRTEAL